MTEVATKILDLQGFCTVLYCVATAEFGGSLLCTALHPVAWVFTKMGARLYKIPYNGFDGKISSWSEGSLYHEAVFPEPVAECFGHDVLLCKGLLPLNFSLHRGCEKGRADFWVNPGVQGHDSGH